MRKKQWQIPMTVVFLFVGILLSLQFQAQSRIASDLTMQRTENLIAMVRGLSEKRQKLALEITDLSIKLNSQRASDQDEKNLMESLTEELEKLSIVTGATNLKGTGLTITIDESMAILYIDIINIINELWAAGAEAISINDKRIIGNTVIFYTEDEHMMYITVNNRKLEYPIIISVIGDSNNLEKGLTIPGGIMDNLALFEAYPLLEKVNEITIPAVTTKQTFIFLQEYKPLPEPTPAANTAAANNITQD